MRCGAVRCGAVRCGVVRRGAVVRCGARCGGWWVEVRGSPAFTEQTAVNKILVWYSTCSVTAHTHCWRGGGDVVGCNLADRNVEVGKSDI